MSSARRTLTSFTLAYESAPPPAQVVQSRPRRPPRHSPSSVSSAPSPVHVIHYHLRCLFLASVHVVRFLRPCTLSIRFARSLRRPLRPSTSSAPIRSACYHRPFPCTFMITLHSADTFLPEQPVTTAVPKTQHVDIVHLSLFQKCPISDTCPFSDTFGRTLSSAPYTFPSTHLPKIHAHLPKVSHFHAFSSHLPKV